MTKKSTKKSIQEIISGDKPDEQDVEQPTIDTVCGDTVVEDSPSPVKKKITRKVTPAVEAKLTKARETRINNEKKRQATQKRIDALREKFNLSLSDVERELEAESSSDDEPFQQHRVRFERQQIQW
jgi:hypothetical protein